MIKLSNAEQFLKKISPEESFSLNFEFHSRRSYCKFFGELASQTLVKKIEKYYFFLFENWALTAKANFTGVFWKQATKLRKSMPFFHNNAKKQPMRERINWFDMLHPTELEHNTC